MTSGWCPRLLALVLVACISRDEGALPSAGGSKDHTWLLHTGFKHSFGNEDDKRLVSTGSRHSFWSEDDEHCPPSCWYSVGRFAPPQRGRLLPAP